MIPKQFDRIETGDVQSLLTNQVCERRTLEYKQALPTNSDGDKKEFLADVSSFANAAGGDLLYGIEEKRDANGQCTGEPDAVPGLAGINADQEILRLESIIRDGVEPRIPGVHVRPIGGFSAGPVLLIRIPKSYVSPHMVTYKQSSRFFSRTSKGKYQLDVTEIRSAFALSESLPDRIRRFRDERLGRIVAGDTVEYLRDGPKVVLHLVPVSAMELSGGVQVYGLAGLSTRLPPMSSGSYDHRYNFDGYLTHNTRDNPPVCHSYTQLFRTGAVEAVDGRILFGRQPADKLFPAPAVERQLLTAARTYLSLLKDLEVQPPLVVMVTLLDVRGYYISSRDGDTWAAFDRDNLLLPDQLVEDLDMNADMLLRPAFDAMWQASGWLRCFSYDEQGRRLY
jgi:hypothetical protein